MSPSSKKNPKQSWEILSVVKECSNHLERLKFFSFKRSKYIIYKNNINEGRKLFENVNENNQVKTGL